MKKILILAGTTEGRMLSDKLEEAGIRHMVSVASEYGETMMGQANSRAIRTGKLDENEMAAYLESEGFGAGDYLVDATHPYAKEVTENAAHVAEKMGLKYLRVAREKVDIPDSDNIHVFENVEQCAEALRDVKEPILITTGSNKLENYAEILSAEALKETYVRVIPSMESIEKCKSIGFEESHIIALQGPFSVELNVALIKQYGIRHLVTKESGKAGGFAEKIEAAESCGISTYVIARPEEEGMTFSEVEKLLVTEFGVGAEVETNSGNVLKLDTESDTKSEASFISKSQVAEEKFRTIELILAGAGMGDKLSMTEEVLEAVNRADAVFGAKRLLEDIENKESHNLFRAEDVLDVISSHPEYKKNVVLFSGDSGFYSGAKSFLRDMENSAEGMERIKSIGLCDKNYHEITIKGICFKISVLPGISSVSYLAAKLGESYEDAGIYSLHGRFSKENLNEILWNIKYQEKAFVLFSGAQDVNSLAKGMKELLISGEITLGINLSSKDEELVTLSLDEAEGAEKTGSIIGFIRNLNPERRPLVPYFKDEDFIRDNTPITKEVIRHESIRRLELREGDLVFDIGGGTGSVAIEIGSLHPSIRVLSVEKKKERVEILRQNIANHHANNVQVIEGEALEVLRENIREFMNGKTKPDAVFIGGSGGELREIISTISKMGEGIHFVINAVTLETIHETEKVLEEFEPKNRRAVQIGVSNLADVGDYHMFRAENPVMIYSFEL